MTQNQISLAKIREEERSNKVREAEEARHNRETETISQISAILGGVGSAGNLLKGIGALVL